MGAKEVFSIVSGVLFVAAFVPYICATIVGTTKPAKASWIIWASLDTITLAGMFVQNAVNGQIIGAVCGAWIVVAFAFKYGTPGWTKLDKFCLGGAVCAIVLWVVFNNPTLGIVTSVSVVFLGAFPTFASAYRDPNKEDKLAWTIFWVSCACAVFAIPGLKMEFCFPQLKPEDAAQPIVFFLIESTMMFLLFIKPIIKRFSHQK